VYCGAPCQRAHWPHHKPLCSPPAARTFPSLLAAAAAPVDAAACLAAAPPAPLPPAVALAPSPGAGRGLFATRAIPALTEIFTDAAALWWPLEPCDDVGATIVGCGTSRPGLSPTAVAGVLLGLAPWAPSSSPASAAPGAAAAAAPPPPPRPPPPSSMGELFSAACTLNALGLCVDEGPPRRVLPCIAPIAAMLNHSCAPNCSYEGALLPGGVPAVRIFSEVPIAEGEELTISYVLRSLPREERRARLRAGYGIRACRCARCAEAAEGAWVARCARCGGPTPLVIGGGAPPCGGCGLQNGAASPEERAAWLRRAEGAPPAALLGLLPAAPPPLLHIDDQDLFSLVYRGLGALWGARGASAHARSVEVVTRVCGSGALARAGRGAAFAGDVLLFAGHLCSLAAAEAGAEAGGGAPAREAAAAFYARAEAALAAVYGPGDARVGMARRFLAAPAASRGELEAAEAARIAGSANWCARYPALKAETLERWCVCPLREPGSREEMAAALAALKGLREITQRARAVAMEME